MTTYYWMLLIVSFAATLATALNINHQRACSGRVRYSFPVKICLFAIIVTLVIVSGFRYAVGTDFFNYYKMEGYSKKLDESLKTLDEPVLPLLAAIVSIFTDNGSYFLLVCAALTITLSLVPCYKYTNSFVFVTLLYIFAGLWHGSFNGVRQFLAAAVVFSGHRLILQKKFWKYLLVVFIAFCVHRSAIVMLIPYFILNNRVSVKNLILLAIGTLIVAWNYEDIFRIAGLLKDSDMQMTDAAYYTTSVSILRVLVACAPAIFFVILYLTEETKGEERFYINALVMNAAAMVAMSNSAYLARLAIYTNMFSPLAIARLLRLKNKQIETVIKVVIVALFAVYWYIEVSGSSSLNNFQWA